MEAESGAYGPRTIGYFVMTEGELAPDGGYRQCRVLATRSGRIILAPMGGDDWGAIINTVRLWELSAILGSFYAQGEPEADGETIG